MIAEAWRTCHVDLFDMRNGAGACAGMARGSVRVVSPSVRRVPSPFARAAESYTETKPVPGRRLRGGRTRRGFADGCGH